MWRTVEATVRDLKVGTTCRQLNDRLNRCVLAAWVCVAETPHVTTRAPDHPATTRIAAFSGQPRQAAVTHDRVSDDRQRPQRRRRDRKCAALKRPEVVVGKVEVPQRRRVT